MEAQEQPASPQFTRSTGCLAYALARICFGTNILLHGVSRIPHLDVFLAKLAKQFAPTFLPPFAVNAAGYCIVFGEAVIGLLVLIGLGLRGALVAGMGLMLLLQFGTGLVQDWSAAGLQLTYVAFYAVLLAAVRYDRWSIDCWRSQR